MSHPSVRLFATCAKGLEYLLRDELAGLDLVNVRETRAGVHFDGTLKDALRTCLWSRLASRVLWPLAEFEAGDDNALYAAVKRIDWSQHLADDGTFVVHVTIAGKHRDNSHFLELRVKDAVVDQFREKGGSIPRIDKKQPDLCLNVHIQKGQGTLSLDLAGAPLHQRGWRDRQGLAPLKENLAAAMLLRANWPSIYARGGVLVDPMCGSGTLLIEAAWMAADVAPGLCRQYFGFKGWKQCDIAMWQSLHEQARQRADQGLKTLRDVFFGSDIDPRMVKVAIHNAQNAGVAGFIQLARRDVLHVQAPSDTPGLVITNPPYGERLGEKHDMPQLYRQLGRHLQQAFTGWQVAVLAGDLSLGRVMKIRSHKQYKLYNGSLETPLLLFDLSRKQNQPLTAETWSEQAQALANRLKKNNKHLRKQLDKKGITCWRAYDRDLPDYAAAIDVYTDVGGQRYLHVQEYRAPRNIPEATSSRRLRELLAVAANVLDVPEERIAVKQRKRGKGGARYGVFDRRQEMINVEEGGLRFQVNLFDYLDTGLFCDHRLVRQKIAQLARGKRFLNLFAYTGTASVYAAQGGAEQTVSVDLSATYLQWASANLSMNKFEGRAHQLAQADCFAFLREDTSRYGLIYVDPPTFSNSKSAPDFDVQRDHVALLEACAKHLEKGGIIVFSNNYKGFKMDTEALSGLFEMTDWHRGSIPFDFRRSPNIHKCWLLQLK